MRQFFLCFMYCIIAGKALAQREQQYHIPEFAKIPAENRYDSIYQWYMDNMCEWEYSKLKDHKDEKLRLLNKAMEYADHSDDMATKVSMTFFLGHYYSNVIDSAIGTGYLNEARNMAEKQGLEYEWANFTHILGVGLFIYHPAKSLEYVMRAAETMKRLGVLEKDVVMAQSHTLGAIYYHLRNYRASIQTLIPVIEAWKKISKIDMLHATNTIGLAYREMGERDSAVFYFRKVLVNAENAPTNTSWIGIAAGNIGGVYFKRQQIDSALIYARLNYDLVKNNPTVSGVGVAEALLLLGSIHMKQHKPDLVLSELLPAEKLIMGKQIYYSPNTKDLMLKVYYTLAKAYHERGNLQPADMYMQKALALQEELSDQDNTEVYTRVQAQLEAEKSISKLKDTENEIHLSVQRRNFSIAGLCFTGLILFSLYRRQRIRNKKNKQLFDSREQLLFLEKKRAEENLVSYMESLQEKNRLIEHVQQEIELLGEENDNPEKQEVFEVLNKLKRSTIITNEDWVEFKSLFENAYGDFFSKLKEKFPDISPAEMRMMALMKLDIPTRRMADMLGISLESIRKTQYRFVKKINSEGVSDLAKIVNSL